MKCPSCGRKTDILANYCSNCGADLNRFYGLKKEGKRPGDVLPLDLILGVLLGIGVPAITLIAAQKRTDLSGGAAFTSGLASIGPGGMTGGLVTLLVIAVAVFLLVRSGIYMLALKAAKKSHASGSPRNITTTRASNYMISKGLRSRLIEKIRTM